MRTFTPDLAAALPGPDWLRDRRTTSFETLASMSLPSEKEEVWRYTPIDRLDLDRFHPVEDGRAEAGLAERGLADGWAADMPKRSGVPLSIEAPGWPPGSVGRVGLADARRLLGSVQVGGDALVRLNDAFHPDAVIIDLPAGQVVEGPLLIVHWCDGATGGAEGTAPASFPRTLIRVGRRAQCQVVEVLAGVPAGDGLVVPVTELMVEEGGQLAHVSVQTLGPAAWSLARTSARIGRDATARIFTLGLGGAYARIRADATIAGQGGTSELNSVYLGTGSQVHDVRTKQEHAAPRTISNLLCKGAVADQSRSVYTGLIRVERGAVRSDAMQTNHNLVLDQAAHADSVPNLAIEENDVRCSHASTVGPVDADQRYYLESRGVPPARAERLIVLGFFEDIVVRAPIPAAIGRLRQEVGARLVETVDRPLHGAVAEPSSGAAEPGATHG